MSIRDVMDTSWEDLMGVLGTMEMSEQEEVLDLADFLESQDFTNKRLRNIIELYKGGGRYVSKRKGA